MLYPIELWVQAREANDPPGLFIPSGRAFYSGRIPVTTGNFPLAGGISCARLRLPVAAASFHGLYGWRTACPPFPSQPWRHDFSPMKKEDVYARMMHTPDDPVRAELRAALRDAWKQLLPLHRALIDAASADYAASVAPVSGPGHLLTLLQEDPFFEWLRPLTSLIVDIDSASRTDFEREDVDALVKRIESLFGTSADASFAARYVPILQRDIDVAAGHAALRQIVRRLLPPA
jgi:hypothetical protein